MHILIGIALVLGAAAVLIAGIALMLREYDRHPGFARFIDMEGRAMYPAYTADDDADITPEYRSEIPGWDDRP